MNPTALIETAKALVVERPSDEVMAEVEAPSQLDEIMIWTYQIEGNGRTAFYNAMIGHQGLMAAHFGMKHYTDNAPSPDVDMFERCKAMCWWIHHTAHPTAFLDNDAFPNAYLRPVFDQIQDVGLTVRDTPGLMPVNEGVIFAKPTEAARKFFLFYVGTYERLRDTMAYDDWRWWGGQLALNAVAETITGPTVRYLPCETYNFSPDEAMTREALDRKVILHLKGPRKALFDQLVAYQDSRCA